MVSEITPDDVLTWLEDVYDPEIPVLSLVDLGVITRVTVEGARVVVEMTPTFVGCPAIDYMRQEVITCLQKKGVAQAEVEVNYRNPWSSDNISAKGRAALKKYGLAPPPDTNQLFTDLEVLERPPCPRCNSDHTELKNPFGPTLCRAIYYCHTCREAFQQFKPV
jgi:ring-1,2-phenylacetyl-CoA epoxidase subunit PaaD